MSNLLNGLLERIGYYFTVSNLIEIVILTFLIYRFILWIYNTQAFQIVKGAIVLLALLPICDYLGFTTLAFIIRSAFTWLFLSIVILFQPELRSAFEKVGTTLSRVFSFNTGREAKAQETIDCLVKSIKYFSETKTGALIVCEAETGLKNLAKGGVILNAKLSDSLLRTIFFKNTPLHDGAAIISIYDDEIIAAACILPLTERTTLPGQMGTRHRAGVGISEQSDALTIVVSEETGNISLTENWTYDYDITLEELHSRLVEMFITPLENESKGNFFTRAAHIIKNSFKSSKEKTDDSN